MKLQTHVPLECSLSPISYESRLILLGSCFVTNIGSRLQYFKFRQVQNPFGILYQPGALQNLINRSVRQAQYTPEELFFHGEGWHCYDAHSQMSRLTAAELLQALNQGLLSTLAALQEGTHVVITLGTAWAYRHKASGSLVANCHKVPQKEFSRELMPPGKIEESLKGILADIWEVNPKLHCLFTISPVRHLKDGFAGNQRSKAHLISALHSVLESNHGDHRLSYFPAYEILLDELRDYRFYDRDLMHPNQIGIDYIWEKFRESYIAEDSLPVMQEIDGIQKALQHRQFNPDSEASLKFRESLEEKIRRLGKRFPFITFEE